MAVSTVPKVPRDGTITITDDTNTYTVAYENGNASFGQDKDARIVIRDRGVIVASRKGEQPVLQFTFDVHFREWANASVALVDVLDGSSNATGAGWAKISSAHEEWNLKLQLTVEGTDHGDGADHVATFTPCIFTWQFSEGEPDAITVTAEVMGAPTFTGPT